MRKLWFTLALLFCFSGAEMAAAKKKPLPMGHVKAPKTLSSAFVWQVNAPTQTLDSSVWAVEGVGFLEIPLTPKDVFEIRSPVISTKGLEILPSNTILIPFSGEEEGACTANKPGTGDFTSYWTKLIADNICFVDSNKDGLFDQYFLHFRDLIGSILVYKNRNSVVPFSIVSSENTPIDLKKNIYLQYSNFASVADILTFHICLDKNPIELGSMRGIDYYPNCLSPGIRIKRSALPQSFLIFGANFAVENKIDKRVLVRQTTPLVSQQFIIN